MSRGPSRTLLLLAAVAVAVAGAALVWLTRPGDEPATKAAPSSAGTQPDSAEPRAAAAEPAEAGPAPEPADETSVQLLDMSIAMLQQRIEHLDPDSPAAKRMQAELDQLLETREQELEAVDEDAVPGLGEYGPAHVEEGVADEELVAGDD